MTSNNPLLTPSELPFQAPPFDTVKDSDYAPAYAQAIAEQMAELTAIADNPAAPSFDNTLVALERSGRTLARVDMTFNAVYGANANPVLDEVNQAMAPKLAALRDAKFLNARLFERIRALYEARDALSLDPESARLLAWYHDAFVHNGAALSADDKARLEALNQRESTLSSQFESRLRAATRDGALVVDDRSLLEGLSPGEIEAAALAASERGLDGKWVLTLCNTTQQPELARLTHRELRRQLYARAHGRTERGDANDTRELIAELARVRAQKARLLGHASYAAWKLEHQVAKTPEAVLAFVRAMVPPTMAKAREQAAELQVLIDQDGLDGNLQACDWAYYSDKLRKARYDFSEDQVKAYLELDKVLHDGVFHAARALYGLSFERRHDLPVYHPDVMVHEVFDADGKPLGLFYADYFKRDNKQGGAWMNNLVEQSRLLGTLPVITNVCNFSKPAPGQPALISFDDVTTMFHEFGHALHGFFADQQYASLSGTSVPRDFVELPSQFNEHWASHPAVFDRYAVHVETGEPMPRALADKLHASHTFDQGYKLGELLSAALLDMSWHTLPADAPPEDVDEFEAAALAANHTDLAFLPPRYRSSYFSHIWGGGYAAGYYAYLWAEMLDNDAFQWFLDHGGLTRANGQRFRDMILSRGNSQDPATLFRAFYGKDPDVGPMLRDRGIQ